MKREDFVCPDLGNPFQHCDSPKPIDFELTPQERDDAKIVSLELERQRRERNKADADKDIVKLGVVFADDDPPEAA